MGKYQVIHDATGVTVTVESDAPPDADKQAQILALPEVQEKIQAKLRDEVSEDEDSLLYQYAGAPILEAGAGITRGTVDMIDFWTTDPVNSAIENVISPSIEALGGDPIDARMPSVGDIPFVKGGASGNFMEEGTPRDIVRGGSEIIPSAVGGGGALRQGAKLLPAQRGGESVVQGITRQMGKTTAKGDAGYGALAGGGAVAGGEGAELVGGKGARPYGEIAGMFFAPMAGAGGSKPLSNMLKSGWKGIKNFFTSAPKGMSDDGMSTLLAEAMIREGLTPDDVIKRLNSLGAEGVPADVGNNFARLLRVASNKMPRIQGNSFEVLDARQRGAGGRLLSALDDASGTSSLTLDDEITRIDEVMKPRIAELYKATNEQGMSLSPKLRAWFEGDNSIGRAQKEVAKRLADKRSMGESITHIDKVNATKQVLDDQIGASIRKGNMNKARDLVRLKNAMVEEADTAIPVYKTARDLHAGKMSLESAGDQGTLFFKMKPRDMQDLTKTFSESEKRMFKLGAKQAILDKVDDVSMNADMVKRLFGKNGDVKKLRYLFDDDASFNRFSDTLKREARFALTRRAIEGNSSTFQQASDAKSYADHYTDVTRALTNPRDAGALLNKILTGLTGKRAEKEYMEALEKAGYLLATTDVDTKVLYNLLKTRNDAEISKRVRDALLKELETPYASAVGAEAVVGE